MTGSCSKSRWFSRLSPLILLLVAASAAAELPLRPFDASYDLYKGGMHLARTRIALERHGGHWRWSTSTKARSIYALFSSKQPYTRTIFTPADGEIRLRRIIVGLGGTTSGVPRETGFDITAASEIMARVSLTSSDVASS